MIEIKRIKTSNTDFALIAMRAPYASYARTDFGEADFALARKLVKAGPEHRKFLRQIQLSIEINAPLYWWKEFDTYKVGTVSNSESTMHCITKREAFTEDMFSFEDTPQVVVESILCNLNHLLNQYDIAENKTEQAAAWRAIIQTLPTSWNQTRFITMNYETLYSIIHQRQNHRLQEWKDFINIVLEKTNIKSFMEDYRNEENE